MTICELKEKLNEYDLQDVIYLLENNEGEDAIHLADEIIDVLNKIPSVVHM